MASPMNTPYADLLRFGGYTIHAARDLEPRLERERSRDGSCVNLTTRARNEKRIEEASKVYVMHDKRLIFCAPFMVARIEQAIAGAR